jgi:hypothetical protein
MESKMAFLSKATLMIAGAATLAASTPALAQSRDYGRGDRGDGGVGALIVGALVIGGIAIAASSASRNRGGQYGRNDGYDGRDGYRRQWHHHHDHGYDRGYDQRGYDNRGYDQRGYDNRGYDNRGYDQRGGGRDYDWDGDNR